MSHNIEVLPPNADVCTNPNVDADRGDAPDDGGMDGRVSRETIGVDNTRVESALVKKPRDYQWSVFKKACEENVLAILPTNSGKTLIATLLIHEYLSLPCYFDKITIFVAPTVILCHQQTQSLVGDLTEGSDANPSLYGKVTHKIPVDKEHAGSMDHSEYRELPSWIDTRKDMIRCLAGGANVMDVKVGVNWDHPGTWKEMFEDLAIRKEKCTEFFRRKCQVPDDSLRFPHRRSVYECNDPADSDLQPSQEEFGPADAKATDAEDEEEEYELNERLCAWPRVFVMTPDKLLMYLEHSMIRMDQISLLVVDECHHINSNDPMRIIMDAFYHCASLLQQRNAQRLACDRAEKGDTKTTTDAGTSRRAKTHEKDLIDITQISRPRILGLSASPINKHIEYTSFTSLQLTSVVCITLTISWASSVPHSECVRRTRKEIRFYDCSKRRCETFCKICVTLTMRLCTRVSVKARLG